MASRTPIALQGGAGFFRQPAAVRWAFVVMPLYYLGIAGGGTAVVAGALAGGAVVAASLDRRPALVLFGFMQVAAGRGPGAHHLGAAVGTALIAVTLLHLAYGVTGTAIFTVSMDWTRPQRAGTDYTVQACFAQLCSHGAGAVSLSIAGVVGYASTVAVSMGLGLAGTAAVWMFQQRPVPATA